MRGLPVRSTRATMRAFVLGAAAALAALLAGLGAGCAPEVEDRIAIEIDFGPAARPEVRAEAVVIGAGARSVLDLTRQVARVATARHPELGLYIVSINGVAADSREGLGWHYTVNGVAPPESADRRMLGPTDRVEWRYGPDGLKRPTP